MNKSSKSIHTSGGPNRWDTSRFMCLAKAHIAESTPRFVRFGWILVGLFVALFVFYMLVIVRTLWGYETQFLVYWVGLFITGYAFASIYFEGMSRRGTALLWLMQPASVLEKTLLCALLVAVVYPLAYTALFLILNVPATELSYFIYQMKYGEESKNSASYSYEWSQMRHYWPFVFGVDFLGGANEVSLLFKVWGLQAWALAAVLWFKRFGVMLGLVVGFVIMLITFFVLGIAHDAGSVLGVWWDSRPLAEVPLSFHMVSAAFWLGVPGLLWGLVGINLRDKELP